jgi:type IV pilus assembly protein PilV
MDMKPLKTGIAMQRNAVALASPPIRNQQQGVTLIEILITLLVLSVGLLGLAALQGISLQTGQVSYHRTQATNVAYEIADFARANRSIATQTLLESMGNRIAQRRLPAGGATVTAPDANEEITVTVTWLDDRSDEASETTGELSFEITTRI